MIQATLDARTGAEATPIQPGLEAFVNIAENWGLSVDEQLKLLGSPARSTFFKWKKEGGLLPQDTKERISHLLGIYKDLHILFTVPERADEWPKRSNRYFNDRSALDVMLGGKVVDIYRVRQHLDAQRGG